MPCICMFPEGQTFRQKILYVTKFYRSYQQRVVLPAMLLEDMMENVPWFPGYAYHNHYSNKCFQ